MTILYTIKKLEKSKIFISWKKEHKEAYLAHAFRMNDDLKIWQVGYYNPKTNLITVFVVDKEIEKSQDAEVFKEQEKLVKPLKLADVKIDEEEAMKEGNKILSENYKVEIFKSFMILQNLEKVGQVWNITFVTQQFKTVNVKINTKTGKCLSHKEISLMSDTKNK